MQRTVLSMLEQAVERFPEAFYLNEKTQNGWNSYTYREVNRLSDELAGGLIDLGFQKGDRIALLSEGRCRWVIGEYAILKAGCICVPLSVNLLAEEILFRLQHSEARAILVSANTIRKLAAIWSKIQANDFTLICFDETDTLKPAVLEQQGLLPSRDITSLEFVLEKGRYALQKDPEPLRQRKASIREDEVVTISYTSGTTGNPKGIMLTHLNYWSNSRNAFNYFGLPLYWKTLIILPLDHSFAHTIGIYISLLCALSIYFLDARQGHLQSLKNIPENLQEVQPELLLTVPALTRNFMKKISERVATKGTGVKRFFDLGLRAGLRVKGNGCQKPSWTARLMNYPIYKLADKLIFQEVRKFFGGSLKFCVGGGAFLDLGQQEFFYALNVPVFQGYGLTEAAPIVSTNCQHTHKLGTSGKIINNQEARIIDSGGSDTPAGQIGQIALRGENIMKGYFKNPMATREAMLDSWLLTGDLGYFDSDGFLVITGRMKALLISADGEKYSPEGMEEAIVSSSEFVHQVMIYNDYKRYTTALVTLEQGMLREYARKHQIEDPERLLDVLKDSFYAFQRKRPYAGLFPSKWIPSVFRIVEEPFSEKNKMLNSTMKMVRHRIEEFYSEALKSMYTTPGNTIHCPQNIWAIQKILENSGE